MIWTIVISLLNLWHIWVHSWLKLYLHFHSCWELYLPWISQVSEDCMSAGFEPSFNISLFLIQFDVIILWQFKKEIAANNPEKYSVDVDQYMLLACTCEPNSRRLCAQLLDLSAYTVVSHLLIKKKRKEK